MGISVDNLCDGGVSQKPRVWKRPGFFFGVRVSSMGDGAHFRFRVRVLGRPTPNHASGENLPTPP